MLVAQGAKEVVLEGDAYRYDSARSPRPGALAQRIAGAIRWLSDPHAGPLSVEALAKHVGLVLSAFRQRFTNVTALGPLQYQKRLRLREARRLMPRDGLGAGEASFRVSYESHSQFGREYLRMLGAPPRRDVDALTAVPQTAS